MAIVKALRRLASGGFGLISASDQIACDAGAMTVTPTGGTQQSVPDAIGTRVLANATGGVSASKLGLSDTQSLVMNGDFGQGADNWYMTAGAAVAVSTTATDLPAGAPAANAVKIVRATSAVWALNSGGNPATADLGVWGFPIQPTDQFYVEFWAYCTAAGNVNGAFYQRRASDGVNSGTPQFAVAIPANTWTKVTGLLTPTQSGRAIIQVAQSPNGSTFWATNVRVMRRNGVDLLPDFSIGPAKIYAPTRGQFFRALENSGVGRTATITDAVPSDRGDATNIAFNHATFVTQTGTLAQFVKTTLSLTDAQLATIMATARQVTE